MTDEELVARAIEGVLLARGVAGYREIASMAARHASQDLREAGRLLPEGCVAVNEGELSRLYAVFHAAVDVMMPEPKP